MITRSLVVLLACMNLAVGLWWFLHRVPAGETPPPLENGVGGLVLLGEAEAPASPDAAELAGVPVPMPEQPVCLSLGPFGTPAELRAAMNALTPLAARIQYRELPATEVRGYRVFLPAAASREQALAAARQLAARGVRDYYVVTAGDQENTVSLGLFNELANAEKRREEIAAQGFGAQLEPRTEQATQWWIDLVAEPGLDWAAALGQPRGVEARVAECD
ncbi:SPOR domain-containing protein [Arenimonas sp.]|uniref:SPOR domain-containing protein n=1 Tax=Arenimonas sp. TaxID=1872635 RepID=UPI0035B4ABE0